MFFHDDNTVLEWDGWCTANQINVRLNPASTRDATGHVVAITTSGLNLFENRHPEPSPLTRTTKESVAVGRCGSQQTTGTITCLASAGGTKPSTPGMSTVSPGSSSPTASATPSAQQRMPWTPPSGKMTTVPISATAWFTSSMPAAVSGAPVVARQKVCTRVFGNSTWIGASRLTRLHGEFLQSLARNFHDPSCLYCDESPYKGLP